ncbi:MAG: hypothetical protein HGA94_03755 [Candidatus Aminicenantes bacterium]|nr:hypothetical protein [Candidatus Aminicenantes bacterium]
MNSRPTVALIGLGLLLAAIPVLAVPEDSLEAKIGRARAVVLGPEGSREAIAKALVDVLDASLLILPKTDYAEEFRSRVETVKKMFEDGALLEEKVRQYLGFAYKMVSGGKSWEVPEELKSAYREVDIMERAKRICAGLLDSALAEHKAGRRESAVRDLISFVIFVITPVEA